MQAKIEEGRELRKKYGIKHPINEREKRLVVDAEGDVLCKCCDNTMLAERWLCTKEGSKVNGMEFYRCKLNNPECGMFLRASAVDKPERWTTQNTCNMCMESINARKELALRAQQYQSIGMSKMDVDNLLAKDQRNMGLVDYYTCFKCATGAKLY